MNPQADLELLMARVEETMDAQQHYFKHKGDTWLNKSKAKESALIELVKNLRRKGYNPEKYKTTTEQNKIF